MRTHLIRSVITDFVRRATGPIVFRKPLPEEFGGASLYVTSRSDMRLLYPGYRRAAQDLLTVAQKYIRRGDVVWDLGSNLGIFAFAAAYVAGERGEVDTVEADPKYAELQNRTAARLPCGYAPVNTLCAAIADHAGILELSIPRNGHARNHLSIVEGNDAGMPEATKAVVAITCDFLLQHWPAPRFVKMDIEGAELIALRGATRLLEVIRPLFYVEVGYKTRTEVTRLFRNAGYRLCCLNGGGEEIALEQCAFNTIAIPC